MRVHGGVDEFDISMWLTALFRKSFNFFVMVYCQLILSVPF